ncbi:MAG TPA: single-stranded DNA-binding protein [Candidatus Paceibacterota bacterium]|jgi:single-strand DNA-binding protein|nr:single-stranded DNA-binding protein [Candidatus Paceibacterota bacterium]HQC46011.1 single-stranded DNA-binding protein [Candidatus Paceibacterota bacterium]
MYLNKAFLIGNLTRDPELKALPSGINVCSFSVATNRVWKDKNGEKQEAADFHNIVVFGRQAETVAQYMKKGSQVMVEGRMQTRSWDDQATGTKKYRTEVIADRVQFGTNSSNRTEASSAPKANASEDDKEELETIEYPDEQINVEDIPF